jgi:2'-deoxynucleoside 5'-phosphate N-hydrolase
MSFSAARYQQGSVESSAANAVRVPRAVRRTLQCRIVAMRIYLACTVRGHRGGVLAARAVAERLRALGHDVLTSHLLDDRVESAESALSEREVFDRDRAWLDACDALIAEASGSSYGVGFEVGYVTGRAAATGQRVFVLFDAARRQQVSRLVSGYADERGATCAYETLEQATAFVETHFGKRT